MVYRRGNIGHAGITGDAWGQWYSCRENLDLVRKFLGVRDFDCTNPGV